MSQKACKLSRAAREGGPAALYYCFGACFMDRLMRCFFSSTSRTITFTTSPTDTTSDGWLDELVADLGDVDQAVLVDADVHKHAEIHHVADGARQHHAGLQVLDLQHVRSQNGGRQLVPDVPAGLGQLRRHVLQGGNAHAQPGGGLLPAQGLHLLGQVRQPPGGHVGQGIAAQGQQSFRSGVALRMDAGVVQHSTCSPAPAESPPHC